VAFWSTTRRTPMERCRFSNGSGLIMGATLLIVLRAFANGGSSLTGVEAISNTVNAFRPAGKQQCASGC